MEESEYIRDRVDHQIAWYDGKSLTSQRAYKALRIIEIAAAAMIPLLVGYADQFSGMKLLVGGLGVCVAMVAGLLSLYRFQENWTGYRATCETLRHEKFLFVTRTEPYHREAPFGLFVQRVESLISSEHSSWTQYIRAQEQGAKDA